jgi:hypothetical protein
MWGNMNEVGKRGSLFGSAEEGLGLEVDVVEFWVVFDGKLGMSGLDRDVVVGGKGCSFASIRSVSAATIPPMECPMRIVCTDGSIAADGVRCATSISITLFSSLNTDFISHLAERCSTLKALVNQENRKSWAAYHSRKRLTHSLSSPRVSNLGYVIATTSTLGSAWLISAWRCSGKVPNVSSPPWKSQASAATCKARANFVNCLPSSDLTPP